VPAKLCPFLAWLIGHPFRILNYIVIWREKFLDFESQFAFKPTIRTERVYTLTLFFLFVSIYYKSFSLSEMLRGFYFHS
jgi:hypothetical protein